jgi:hypothetical protein
MNYFSIMAATINFLAALRHCTQREWNMAVVWGCYGVAAVALAFVK